MSVEPLSALDVGARGSRAQVAGPDPAGPLNPAAAAVLGRVAAWWTLRATAVGLSGAWLDVTVAVASPAPAALATAPQGLVADPLATPEALGASYVAALDRGVRSRHGRHYTPPDLAQHLWAMARDGLGLPARATRLPGLVRDRASGAGALLLPAVREHLAASSRIDPAVALAALPELVEGVDADPNAVWLANVFLAAEALPVLAAVPATRRKPFPALVTCGDGLTVGHRPARVELQNPPYGRVRLPPEDRARWAHVLYGHANLYAMFLGAALEDLDDDGVLAALVPTSFTSGRYFTALRGTLAKRAPLRSATFVAERDGVFANVLQETCLTVFTRRRPRWTSIASINGHVEPVARVKSPRGEGPWLLPRRADDAPVAASAAQLPLRLRDIGYRCSTGPLVWNRRAADLSAATGVDAVEVVWAADLDGGRLHRDPARNAMRFLSLRPGDQRYLLQRQPAVLIQRTTAPEQRRRLVAAHLSGEELLKRGGQVVVENHVNVLKPVNAAPLVDPVTLSAVLGSRTLDRVMRSLSGSVAVSAYEIESLPFPDATTVASWSGLTGSDLEQAIAFAYRTVG